MAEFNEEQKQALHRKLADALDNAEKIKTLLSPLDTEQRMAVLSVRDFMYHFTPLDAAARDYPKSTSVMLEGLPQEKRFELLKRQSKDGYTALHNAQIPETVTALLEGLTDSQKLELLSIRDEDGRRALDYAASPEATKAKLAAVPQEKHFELLKQPGKRGFSALHYARSAGDVSALLSTLNEKQKAELLGQKNDSGRTPREEAEYNAKEITDKEINKKYKDVASHLVTLEKEVDTKIAAEKTAEAAAEKAKKEDPKTTPPQNNLPMGGIVGALLGGLLGFMFGEGIGAILGAILGWFGGGYAEQMMNPPENNTSSLTPGAGADAAKSAGKARGIELAKDGSINASDLNKALSDKPSQKELRVLSSLEKGERGEDGGRVLLMPEANGSNLGPVIYAAKDASGKLTDIQVALEGGKLVKVEGDFNEKDPKAVVAAARESKTNLNKDDDNVLVDDIIAPLTLNNKAATGLGK